MLELIQTEASIQHLLFLVANRFNNLQNWLKQTEIAETSRFVVEFLSSSILRDSNKDI